EALLAYPGSVIVVSHDRWFLDRVATMILYLDGQGGARLHHGDVSSLLEKLARERAAATPAKARRTESAPVRAKSASKPKRLSPWQQKELEGVENRIGEIEIELAAIDERLADPALYSGPRSEVDAIQQSRESLDGELATLYGRWEELEALRDPSS
ncbi:MAG: ABC transporter ATP-binding protein, partial [Planctomycetota bacterium]